MYCILLTIILGLWPCVSVINDTRNDLVTHLHSTIESIQYFNCTENFLQHFNNRSKDPHFIVLLNPIDIGHVTQLIKSTSCTTTVYILFK